MRVEVMSMEVDLQQVVSSTNQEMSILDHAPGRRCHSSKKVMSENKWPLVMLIKKVIALTQSLTITEWSTTRLLVWCCGFLGETIVTAKSHTFDDNQTLSQTSYLKRAYIIQVVKKSCRPPAQR